MVYLQSIQPVILSGGIGSRLWPISRYNYPKQLLALTSGYSLIQETALRVAKSGFAPPVVLCNDVYYFTISEHLRAIGLKPACIILEPEGRNTAPAVAVAALLALPETILLILPSDHIIYCEDRFKSTVTLAVSAAARGRLVTIGITPDRPETGYGYIRYGPSCWVNLPGVYVVEQFIEKPDFATAQQFLSKGGYLWNSGLFAFQAGRYLDELEHFQPGMANACRAALGNKYHNHGFYRLDRNFRSVPAISVDQAIMEHTTYAAVVPTDMGWNDVGSWSALWESSVKDTAGNVLHGDVLAIDSLGSYVSSEELLTAVVGIRNMIVVTTKDACLVVPRKMAQQVRMVVEYLKFQKRSEYTAPRIVHRPWGYYISIDTEDSFQIRYITVSPSRKLPYKKYKQYIIHWIIVHGIATVKCDNNTFILQENQAVNIPVGTDYSLENNGCKSLQVIEIRLGLCVSASYRKR